MSHLQPKATSSGQPVLYLCVCVINLRLQARRHASRFEAIQIDQDHHWYCQSKQAERGAKVLFIMRRKDWRGLGEDVQ